MLRFRGIQWGSWSNFSLTEAWMSQRAKQSRMFFFSLQFLFYFSITIREIVLVILVMRPWHFALFFIVHLLQMRQHTNLHHILPGLFFLSNKEFMLTFQEMNFQRLHTMLCPLYLCEQKKRKRKKLLNRDERKDREQASDIKYLCDSHDNAEEHFFSLSYFH